jgi:hypothetical protein
MRWRGESHCCLGVEIIEAEASEASLEQWGARRGVLVLCEPGKGVIVEVIGVLVDTPGDSGILVEFRGCLPFFRVALETASFTT